MSFFSVLTWTAIAVLGVVVLGILLWPSIGRTRESTFTNFWRKVGLPIDNTALELSVRSRLSRLVRIIPISGLVGLVAMAAVCLFAPGINPVVVLWLAFFPVMAVSILVLSMRISGAEVPAESAVKAVVPATQRPPRARDYLTPVQLAAPVAMMVVLLALLVTGLVFGATGAISSDVFFASPAIASVIAAVAMLIWTLLAARQALRQRDPAASTLADAWDDAFRVATLRNYALASSQLTVVAGAFVVYGAFLAHDAITGFTTSQISFSLSLLGLLANNLVFAPGVGASRFRKRLWPEYQPPAPGATAYAPSASAVAAPAPSE